MKRNTQGDTAGETILHQQYLLVFDVVDAVILSDVAPTRVFVLELQIATPLIDTSPQFADQFELLPEPLEHDVFVLNFTHLVTADAGGIMIAQISPAINKCFFIFKLLFFLNKKTTRKFGWSGG